MDKTPEEAYVEGRLMGLSELISILKDSMESDESVGSNTLVKSIITHISSEMDSILDDVHGSHPDRAAVKQVMKQKKEDIVLPRKLSEEDAPQVLKRNVAAADDLMKSLLELRRQNVGEE